MSIRLMTDAWKSNLPTGQKMVLLALCDNANDSGECYPSVSMLTEKCSMSERSVFNHLSDLEKLGAIVRLNRTGRSTYYTLYPCKFCTHANSAPLQILHPAPANSAPPPLQPLHPTPATVAPITIIEPSIEPSGNRNTALARPVDVSTQVWDDFVALRKQKRSKLTSTALNGIRSEAAKAGVTLESALETCCVRGWQSFRADWVEKQINGRPMNKLEKLEQANKAIGDEWLSEQGFTA